MNNKPTQLRLDELAAETIALIASFSLNGYSEKEYHTNELTIIKPLKFFQRLLMQFGFRSKRWLQHIRLKKDQYYLLKVFTQKDTFKIYVN